MVQTYEDSEYPGIQLPAEDQSQHYPPVSYAMLWNSTADRLDMFGDPSKPLNAWAPRNPAFPPGTLGPWTTRQFIRKGTVTIGYLDITVHTDVWALQDHARQPVTLSVALAPAHANNAALLALLNTITGAAMAVLIERWAGR